MYIKIPDELYISYDFITISINDILLIVMFFVQQQQQHCDKQITLEEDVTILRLYDLNIIDNNS